MAELVDALDSGSSGRKAVGVRVPLRAQMSAKALPCTGIMRYCSIFLILFLLSFAGCEHGLVPPEVQPGFGGVISYQGAWPADTIDLRLVASKAYRRFSSMDEIIRLVLVTDSVKVYPPIGQAGLKMGVKETRYQFFVEPGEYKLVGLFYRYGSQIFHDWRLVGLYGTYTSSELFPTAVVVKPGEFVDGIDFLVDFDNPPPQPF